MAKKRELFEPAEQSTEGKLNYIRGGSKSPLLTRIRALELQMSEHTAQQVLEQEFADEQKEDKSGGQRGFAPRRHSAGYKGRRL